MSGLIRAIVVLTVTASTISFPNLSKQLDSGGTARRRAVVAPAPTPAPEFKVSDLEFYLTDDGIAYIRPGLKVKILSVTIPSDRKPVVELTLTDNYNQPLDRLGQATPGPINLSFLFASYDATTRHYTSYITRAVTNPANSPNPGVKATQATAEGNGAFTDLGVGSVKYKFANALPADFNQTKTHTVAVVAYRNLQTEIGKTYYDNETLDFRPDGQKITEQWNKINDATSCKTCHDPETFGFHGTSARRDLRVCVLCHQPQTPDPDTGESVDMKVMAHKIHNAQGLTKQPYIIYGNGQSVHNYSENVHYPQDVRNCARCHEGTVAAQKAPDSDVYLTKPGRAACGSCHDDINWTTGANHPAGAQASDDNCATCHVADSGNEFDASIKGAHVIPEKSKQLAGYKAEIVKVENLKAGAAPTVTFKITDKTGAAVDGTKLSTFAPILAGPTTDYSLYARETAALTKAVFDATAGTTTYTFTKTLPADATVTYAFSADIYKTVTLKRADGKADITGIRDVAFNPIKYVAIGTGTAAARRQIVSLALCNNCHDMLALHGGQRRNTDECVICHNPTEGDQARRPANAGAPESISFQRMIHRIHNGAELQQEYSVFGFGGTAINFNNIHFPGDLRNCATCHVGGSYRLPVPITNAPVNTQRDFWAPQGSGTAACLGCHDSKDASAHAFLNTTQFAGKPAEACGVCHGANSEWSADKVHAR
jgi:OmcA/MtrC family decaheme c-type cytochrome